MPINHQRTKEPVKFNDLVLTEEQYSRHPLDCAVGRAAALDLLAVDARSMASVDLAVTSLVAALKIDVLEVKGVDVAREISTSVSGVCTNVVLSEHRELTQEASGRC